MKTTTNLETIIQKIERLYAEAFLVDDQLAMSVDAIRTDLYWAYKEAKERGE